MGGRDEAIECANRCLDEALVQMDTDLNVAASLFRAAARYLERAGEEKRGEIVRFPSPAHVTWARRCALG